MFALILDPCFKSLWVVENYVGHGNIIHLVVEYDVRGCSPSNDGLCNPSLAYLPNLLNYLLM
jgi:hypothetical protein